MRRKKEASSQKSQRLRKDLEKQLLQVATIEIDIHPGCMLKVRIQGFTYRNINQTNLSS